MVTLHEEQYRFFYRISLNSTQNEKLSQKFAEKIKKHILCSIIIFLNCVFYELMWKNIVQPGQATDGNMAQAHCMHDT